MRVSLHLYGCSPHPGLVKVASLKFPLNVLEKKKGGTSVGCVQLNLHVYVYIPLSYIPHFVLEDRQCFLETCLELN